MAVFDNVSGWISKDIEGRESIDDQLSEVASHEMRQRAEEVRQSVSQTISNAISGCSWMSKASRNARTSDPYRYFRTIFPIGWVVGMTLLIASGRYSPVDILYAFIITAIIFIGFNPMDMVSRYLSRQTRFLVVTDMLAFMAVMDRPNGYGIAAALFWSAFTALLCILKNKDWLMAYNWLYTQAVIHAMVKAPDNSGVKSWDDHGKRETRTMLSECGLPSDDDTLQIFAKRIYIVGYYGAWFSTAEDVKAREAAENALKKKETDLMITEKTLKEIEKALKKSEEEEQSNREKYRQEAAARAEAEKKIEELKARMDLMERERFRDASDVPEEGKSHMEILESKIIELRKEINPNTGAPISWDTVTNILHSQGYTESKSTIHRIGSKLEKTKKAS